MIATIDDNNCYRWDRTKEMCLFCDLKMCMAPTTRGRQPDRRGRIIRWCNAPEYVRVAVAVKECEEKAHMKVELEFQYPMDQGKFDYMSIMDTVDRNARENRQEALNGVVKGDTINTVVVCSEEKGDEKLSRQRLLVQGGWL